MRKKGRSAVVVVGALALGAAVVAAIWLRADASAGRAEELQTLCEKTRAYHRRAAAMAELIELDTTASREALEALAANKDDRLAAQALAAMGRANYSGAKDSLTDVVGDGERSDVVRGTALAALFQAEKSDGRTRTQAESAVAAKADGNDMLEGMVTSLGDRVFATTGGGR